MLKSQRWGKRPQILFLTNWRTGTEESRRAGSYRREKGGQWCVGESDTTPQHEFSCPNGLRECKASVKAKSQYSKATSLSLSLSLSEPTSLCQGLQPNNSSLCSLSSLHLCSIVCMIFPPQQKQQSIVQAQFQLYPFSCQTYKCQTT